MKIYFKKHRAYNIRSMGLGCMNRVQYTFEPKARLNKSLIKDFLNTPFYRNPYLYMPFGENLIVSDFQKTSLPKIDQLIKAYWKEGDWEDELPVFKEQYKVTQEWLSKHCRENDTAYYINLEDVNEKCLWWGLHIFSYAILIITINRKNGRLVTIFHGCD